MFVVRVVGLRQPDSRLIQGDKGLPDLVMARDGEVILAELKRVGGKSTEAQEAWISAIQVPIERAHCASHYVFLWTAQDWPEIERVLA